VEDVKELYQERIGKMTKRQFAAELKRTIKSGQPNIMNGGIRAIIGNILLNGNTNGNDPYFNNTGKRRGAGKGTGGLVLGGGGRG
jgi:hypothetical protein